MSMDGKDSAWRGHRQGRGRRGGPDLRRCPARVFMRALGRWREARRRVVRRCFAQQFFNGRIGRRIVRIGRQHLDDLAKRSAARAAKSASTSVDLSARSISRQDRQGRQGRAVWPRPPARYAKAWADPFGVRRLDVAFAPLEPRPLGAGFPRPGVGGSILNFSLAPPRRRQFSAHCATIARKQ